MKRARAPAAILVLAIVSFSLAPSLPIRRVIPNAAAPAAPQEDAGEFTAEEAPEPAVARTASDPSVAVVELPADVPASVFRDPQAARRLDLHRLVPANSCVALFTKNGRPVRPDWELRHPDRPDRIVYDVTPGGTGGGVLLSTAAPTSLEGLTFTYDSPSQPWTAEELSTIQSWIATFVPAIKTVYGPPLYNITINVRKDTSVDFSGLYVAASNELVIKFFNMDVVAHELVHAFRDDAILGVCGYEEPMARAAEVEVFDLLPDLDHPWDDHHGYPYDAHYDVYNRKQLSRFAFFNSLLYYQVGSYVWGKMLVEDPAFFTKFNQQFYPIFNGNPGATSDPAALRAIVETNKSAVEGVPISTWYDQQWTLNNSAPGAYELVAKNEDFAFWYYYRDAYGNFTKISGATVQWFVYNSDGALMASGSGVTNEYGAAYYSPTLPSYTGKMRIVVKTTATDGTVVADSTWRDYHAGLDLASTQGLFGVVVGANTGSVSAYPLGNPQAVQSATVESGQFDIPELRTFRGTLVATYKPISGPTVTRTITKDASAYFVTFAAPNAAPAAPSTPMGPATGGVNANLTFQSSTTDPDGDEVQYTFDWGDGTTSTTAFLPSGSLASASHAWAQAGNYFVKVVATDSKGASSPWSIAKTVGIQGSYLYVKSISFSKESGWFTSRLRMTVKILDQAAKPAKGAVVSVTLKLPNGTIKSASGTTNYYGNANFTYTVWGSLKKGKYTLTVTKVVHPTIPYDSSKNVETSDSYWVW